MNELLERGRAVLESNDLQAVRLMLEVVPGAASLLNSGMGPYGMLPLGAAKSVEMVDLLLEAGAEIEKVTDWWKSGFGAEEVDPAIARILMERGASPSIHAAAALGLEDVVAQHLERDPESVHSKGGDGGRPLHFCQRVEIAKMLIAAGAELDARDDDHQSTPVQWRVGDAPGVTRYLLSVGAVSDIFVAAALGDQKLARRLLEEDPACAGFRIGHNNGPFPGIGHGKGGTIYQWTLGFNRSPHQVAKERGHHELFDLLMAASNQRTRWIVACTMGDRERAVRLVADHPQLPQELGEEDLQLLAKYCWETNKDIEAVRLMLDVGWPVDVPETNHGYAALHNAAWCGDPDLVSLLLEHDHPVDLRDPGFQSTAIGWAIHSCVTAKRHPDGEFAEVVRLLAAAGTPVDEKQLPSGDAAIDDVLRHYVG